MLWDAVVGNRSTPSRLSTAQTCVLFMVSVISATASATVAMIAANAVATLGVGTPACYVVAGIFAGALVATVGFMIDKLVGLYTLTHHIESATQDVRGKIFTDARNLKGNALALSSAVNQKKSDYIPDSTRRTSRQGRNPDDRKPTRRHPAPVR